MFAQARTAGGAVGREVIFLAQPVLMQARDVLFHRGERCGYVATDRCRLKGLP
jgi:hypothetical protein